MAPAAKANIYHRGVNLAFALTTLRPASAWRSEVVPLQQLTMLVTADGKWVLPDSEAFLAALGDPDPDYDAVGFAVRNLGFVKFQVLDRLVTKIELHPRNIELPALLALEKLLRQIGTNLFRIRYLGDGWHSEISASVEHTIGRLRELCAPIFEPPAPAEKFSAEAQDYDHLGRGSAVSLHLLAQKWRTAFGSFDADVISFAIDHQILSRMMIAEVKPGSYDPVFRFIGDGLIALGKTYPFEGVGSRIQNVPDKDYGEWVAEFYKAVAASGQPRYDVVSARIQKPDRDGGDDPLRAAATALEDAFGRGVGEPGVEQAPRQFRRRVRDARRRAGGEEIGKVFVALVGGDAHHREFDVAPGRTRIGDAPTRVLVAVAGGEPFFHQRAGDQGNAEIDRPARQRVSPADARHHPHQLPPAKIRAHPARPGIEHAAGDQPGIGRGDMAGAAVLVPGIEHATGLFGERGFRPVVETGRPGQHDLAVLILTRQPERILRRQLGKAVVEDVGQTVPVARRVVLLVDVKQLVEIVAQSQLYTALADMGVALQHKAADERRRPVFDGQRVGQAQIVQRNDIVRNIRHGFPSEERGSARQPFGELARWGFRGERFAMKGLLFKSKTYPI